MRRLSPLAALLWLLLPEALYAENDSTKLRKFISVEEVMVDRAEKIQLPPFSFKKMPLPEAVRWVEDLGREADKQGGMSITFAPVFKSEWLAKQMVTLEFKGGSFLMAARGVTSIGAAGPVVGSCKGLEVVPPVMSQERLHTLTVSLAPLIFDGTIKPQDVGVDAANLASFWQDPKKYLLSRGARLESDREDSSLSVSGAWLSVTDTYDTIYMVRAILISFFPDDTPGPDVPKSEIPPPRVFDPALSKLRLKQVDFDGTPLFEAVAALNQQAAGLESIGKEYLRISTSFGGNVASEISSFLKTPVHFHARDISLMAAITQIAVQVGGEISPSGDGIYLKEKEEPSRWYRLPPQMRPDEMAGESPWTFESIPAWLEANGIHERELIDCGGYYTDLTLRCRPGCHDRVARLVASAWREYYASQSWILEQKRQKLVQEHLANASERSK